MSGANISDHSPERTGGGGDNSFPVYFTELTLVPGCSTSSWSAFVWQIAGQLLAEVWDWFWTAGVSWGSAHEQGDMRVLDISSCEQSTFTLTVPGIRVSTCALPCCVSGVQHEIWQVNDSYVLQH